MKCVLPLCCIAFAVPPVLAEPSPEDINNYFNVNPDVWTDLDAALDLSLQSDMPDNANVLDLQLIYDGYRQDKDSALFIDASGDIDAQKDGDVGLNIGVAVELSQYGIDTGGVGRLFQFVDAKTADPREFYFADANLGVSQQETDFGDSDDWNAGFSIGIGRGRLYSTRNFHRAWWLSQKLSELGQASGDPSTEQLRGLANVISTLGFDLRGREAFYLRQAEDEAHGLPALERIRDGVYGSRWLSEIWDFLSSEGLVSGEAGIAEINAINYAIEQRNQFNWLGGARARLGLTVSDGELLPDTSIGAFVDYRRYLPVNIRETVNYGWRVLLDSDIDMTASVFGGQIRELNDYTSLQNSATLSVVLVDSDTDVALNAASNLVFEINEKTGLIGSLTLTQVTGGDLGYLFNVRLNYDIL